MPTIRQAKLTDLTQISKLNLELFKVQHRFDPTANLSWTISPAGQKYFKKRILAKDSFVAVAEGKNGNLVGYIIGTIIKRPLWHVNAKYTELESIFIKPSHQSAGLGAQLTADFINWCQKNKVDYVSLLVAPRNQSAINFYRKHGFKDYDLVMQLDLTK